MCFIFISMHPFWILLWTLTSFAYAQEPIRVNGNSRQAMNSPTYFGRNNLDPVITEELQRLNKSLMYPFNRTDRKPISATKNFHDEPLAFRLPFFGFEFTYLWIQKDGAITFNQGLPSYNFPLKLPLAPVRGSQQEDPSIIAPFFALQEIPNHNSVPDAGVYVRVVNIDSEKNKTLRDLLILDFRGGMIGSHDFVPKYAIIVTWLNMTYSARKPDKPLKTNTYQAVIATDEIRTYVMFNYDQIEWVTHEDNFDGKKGSPAFVGFNAGNRTRFYEFRPYSQNARVMDLKNIGFGNSKTGRFFFQVNEEVYPGSCVQKELDPQLSAHLPLTFFPRYGHMLGGAIVNVTGPCLKQSDIIECSFEDHKVRGVYRDENHATCVSPTVMYHGYVDLRVSVNDRSYFLGRFYVQPPDIADADVVVLGEQEREEQPNMLNIKWKPEKLFWDVKQEVNITLWGYRESRDIYPRLTYIDNLDLGETATIEKGSARIDVSKYTSRYNYDKLDIVFGYIGITIRNPRAVAEGNNYYPFLWSNSMPLSWYFKPQWERAYGRDGSWKSNFCKTWAENEANADRFATTVFRCPCTADQALQDMGRFLPDTECNMVQKRCLTFHKGGQRCFRSGRPSIGGAGQKCCYDETKELLQTADTMYGGRPSRAFIYGKHPFQMRMMLPSLSNWLHDVMPFFFCCKWQADRDNAKTCQLYNYWRTSQDCSSYQMPAVGVVFGDPHVVTFDGLNYTFNGRGEYVLVRVDDPVHKLDIQGRFEQLESSHTVADAPKATQLKAVVARDNQSATVEFRVRPAAARWQYHMFVIVDQQYVFFWDESLRVQNFRGVTLYQPEGIKNMSQIIVMFDSGAGVEVMTTDGHLTLHVYLPVTFQNKTEGLLGYYSKLQEDDFQLPGKRRASLGQGSRRDLHDNFGRHWRLTETEQKNVGVSLFWHDPISFSEYDERDFEPDFEPEYTRNFDRDSNYYKEMESTCGDSEACRYDYHLTLDQSFARVTKMHEAWGHALQTNTKLPIIRCPALTKPVNGRKTENRYSPGIVVTFECDPGYRIVGYEHRVCRQDGLWSWGVEAECIKESTYILTLFLIIIGIILPIALIVLCTVGCIMATFTRSRYHYTGEQGVQARFSEVKPYSRMRTEGHGMEMTAKPMEIPTSAREAEI